MKAFVEPLNQLNEFLEIKKQVAVNKGIIQLSGCIDSQKAHMSYCISDGFKYKIIVTFSDVKAKELCEEYRFFDANCHYYPAKDVIFYNADIHGNLITKQRMDCIREIAEERPVTIVTTIDGLMDLVAPLSMYKTNRLSLDLTSTIKIEEMTHKLQLMGYEKNYQVESAGQFSIRGGIIDIYPLTEENPVRIELWDEDVDSIRSFDTESQRTIENLQNIVIYPARETILTREEVKNGLEKMKKEADACASSLRNSFKTEEAYRIQSAFEAFSEQMTEMAGSVAIDSYMKYFYEEGISFLEYFNREDTVLFLDEPNRLKEKASVVELEFRESMMNRMEKGYALPGQAEVLFGYQEIIAKLSSYHCVGLSALEPSHSDWKIYKKHNIDVKSINSYNGSFELLVKDLKQYKKNGYKIALLSPSYTRAKRLAQDLQEQEVNSYFTEDKDHIIKSGEVLVAHGSIHKGFEYPLIKFAVISESDIFGKENKKKKKRKTYEGQKIQSFTDLKIGDYVVHENHGIGIYKGIEKIEVEKTVKDYMKIEYASGGNLYILATQLNAIQKYAGADTKKLKLNKLGSVEWGKTKQKVKGAVEEIARDLVELYATRQNQEGFACGPDTVWQKEFEEMFPYEETEDQLIAIEEVKKDMESTKIMDRLICGDVGYGKTEIALRAAFKAVSEGRQVVYLVPTTILAQQIYNTFIQRMKDFPVQIEMLSRFRTPTEQKRTIEGLRKGQVDVVVGTHRVLSKDLTYKNLGLLIIDEEQRFGVNHKEKIKKLKENIDVLTLTATPIPRTLHMSLIGIRDMSVLEEPPMDRLPIQTFVLEFNEEMIREAVHRELSRGGQVYYVYNRVNTIPEVASMVANLVPEANVAFAHGQMKEHELERIMYDFINGEIDVLVSTTIIETGLDISNVNTMIIHDADQLGLSQLYQLRGRVGRTNKTAYAFLMYKRNKMLKEIAEKRLHAIREFSDLGSGFKISMRDLEIRGAGNLLGKSQHGHMELVGYDMYCKLLNEAVKSLKGMQQEEQFDTTIDMDIDAYIPESYIANEFQKLDVYKRIAGIENEAECEDLTEELIDRFGDIPKSVWNLFTISRIRVVAHSMYVKEIAQNGSEIKIIMYEKAKVNPQEIPNFVKKYNGNIKFTIDKNPYFTYHVTGKSKDKKNIPDIIQEMLNNLKEIIS